MFDNIRISLRIALALGITLAGLLAVAVMAYSGLSSEYHTIKRIIQEDFALAEQIGNVRGAVGNLRRYEKDMLLNMDKLDKVGEYRKKWDGAHAKALESLANLARTSKDDKEKSGFARLQEKVASYAKGFAPIADALVAGQYKTLGEANHAMEAIKGPVREMEGLLDEISGKLAEDSANTEKTVDAQYAAVLRSLAITTLLIFAVTLGLSLAIVRSITQPLRLLREAAQRSATNHDLTVAMPDCGRNELGETIAALRSMNDATRALIAETNRAAGEASRLSGEMAHAAMNVSSASDQQAQATASSAAAIEQFTVSIGVVADNAKVVHADSEHSNAAAAEGAGTARRAGEEIGQIATSLADAGEVMASLSRRSEEIGGIVSVIKDIADQTNLLALNAAIEAARAGETGRGFAVVADEVRKLAERTTQATSEISGMIQNVQADTQSANQAMQSAHGRIEAGVATTLSLVDALGRIQDTSQKVVGTMTEVSDALREQSAASTEIARNVEHITQMSDENSAAASAARQAAESLSEVAHQLESAIGRFKI